MKPGEGAAASATGLLVRAMTPADFDDVLALWRAAEGIGLSTADEPAALAGFLARNPDLSLVALDRGAVAGAVLCGHDGRRGYITHLAVAPAYRRRGLGRDLAERCLAGLAAHGIRKCHLFVFRANAGAVRFWERLGWGAREDLAIMSHEIPGP